MSRPAHPTTKGGALAAVHRSGWLTVRDVIALRALAFCLVLGGAQRASGQSIESLELGARAGVNLASVAFSGGDQSPDRGIRPGLVAGAFATLPLTGSVAFQVEALYSSKGVKATTQGFASSLVTDYLEIPVLVRWGRRSGTAGYYLAGGAAPALRLRARTVADFGNATESIDIGDQVERFDLGVAFGGGIEHGRWVFDGRYTFGLLDMDRDDSDDVGMTHRVISITAGWRF